MTDYQIRETEEYEKLVPFFMKNGLEYTEEDMEEVPTDLVRCWEVISGTDGQEKLIGGFVLAKREGEFICDGIAVDPDYRELKLGKTLVAKGIEEVRRMGGDKMYLVARAPEFFRKNGFITIEREEAPNFFECFTCPQYKVSCNPEVMRIDF